MIKFGRYIYIFYPSTLFDLNTEGAADQLYCKAKL